MTHSVREKEPVAVWWKMYYNKQDNIRPEDSAPDHAAAAFL